MREKCLEVLNILADRQESSYHTLEAACLVTNMGSLQLRSLLRELSEVSGVNIWWDEETESTGDYDFGISICESCFPNVKPAGSKPVCTCQ